MFCPNCSQSFSSEFQQKCPTCGYLPGYELPVNPLPTVNAEKNQKQESPPLSSMESGAKSAVKLILIAVVCFLIYKVLAFFYPATDSLVPGSSSLKQFEFAGQAILTLLFGAGFLRAVYAVTVERKRDLRRVNE